MDITLCKSFIMASADDDNSAAMTIDCETIPRLAPLPQLGCKRPSRRCTSTSIDSFTSDTSVSSDPEKIVQVGDLRFMNANDMHDGQSPLLGKGAFATVRLARRSLPPPPRRNSAISALSVGSHHIDPESPGILPTHTSPDSSTHDEAKPNCNNEGVLVAVKIFEKSLLQKCRTIERDSENQMQVRTALDSVGREIAVMKMIQHPNLVSLYEVIDFGSNRLYMVLEYLPLGEIMSNVQGSGNYKRRPLRKGEETLEGVTPDGHFDEHHAALYFVDIMHGLAHLHKNHIVHRDLKPENILLDSRGYAKISDFGVAHLFEDEMKSAGRSSLDHLKPSDSAMTPVAQISRSESDAALKMIRMSDMGKLTKTEGTWCFWSPEMCAENSLVFSGYTCDIWAAGVCLFIFATGSLPFYSEIPLVLFDEIAAAHIDFDDVKASNTLVDMLKKVLEKDPSSRAGVGDCLQHAYCKKAREQRLMELGEEVEKHQEVTVRKEDMEQAFSSRKQSSARALAQNMGHRVATFKNLLPGSGSSSHLSADAEGILNGGTSAPSQRLKTSKSATLNVGTSAPSQLKLKAGKSEPAAFWRTQNTTSMSDEEGEKRGRSRWTSLPTSFWRPKIRKFTPKDS